MAKRITTIKERRLRNKSSNSKRCVSQEEMRKKGIEEALDKAKETLSNMMEETEEELDKAIITCKAFAANWLARGGGSAKIRI